MPITLEFPCFKNIDFDFCFLNKLFLYEEVFVWTKKETDKRRKEIEDLMNELFEDESNKPLSSGVRGCFYFLNR
jgi:hypothetical protein